MKINLCILVFLFAFLNVSHSQLQWEHLDGPEGSLQSQLYSNDKYAFIPEGDFLFRSTDGIVWEKLIHEVSEFMWVYQDTLINAILNEGQDTMLLQLSFNNGETWIVQNLPNAISHYENLVMCSHGIYFAQGDKAKIYHSFDLGITWDSITAPEMFTNMTAFEDRIYISGDTLLWRTDQNGENWEEIIQSLPSYRFIDDFVAIGSHLIVSVDEYLFISHDNGQSWDTLYASSPNANDKMTLVGNDIYFNIFGAIIRSKDYGVQWDTLITDFYPRPFSFGGLRDIFLITTYDRGVIRWDEPAGKMIESNTGLSKGVVYDLSYGVNKIWAACGNGIYSYDILTGKWSDKMNLPVPLFDFRFVGANAHGWVIAAENSAERLYLSEDDGDTWDTIHTGFEIYDLQLLDEYFFVFGNRPYRSIDKGKHWDTLDIAIISNEIIPFQGKGYLTGAGLLYNTADNGLTWGSMNLPISFYKLYASQDKMFGIDADFILETNLYISDDGIHWTYADEGLPDIDVFTLWHHYHPLFFRDANYHYAFLGQEGHYISSDDALSWSPLVTSLTGTDYFIHENVIYLGGEGLYRSVIEDPLITAVQEIDHTSKTLFTISPNPAANYLIINFDNLNSFEGLVNIYDLQGLLMKSTRVTKTSKSFPISINDLAEGLYFISLVGKNHSACQSFAVIRG